MRNFHAREREKIMMGGFHSGSYQEPEEEKRVDELGEGLSEWELSEHSGLSEQELSRLNNATPQSVFNIVAWIIVILLVIVGMVLLSVFHVF